MSLANKYRPQTFDDVIEQDSIKTVLLNQIKTNNLKHAYLFCGGAGTGKAQPLDSMVLTPTGYVKMRDVYVGQKVIDGLGGITTITDIFPQGKKPIYKVTFSDRTSVLCSDEHLWKVGQYNKLKRCIEWSVKSIKDLLEGGIAQECEDAQVRLKYIIPTPVIQFSDDNELPIDPYLVGVSFAKGNLDDLDIISDKSDKHIPTKYLYSTVNNRIKLLQGLFNTSGYVNKNGTQVFITDNRQLSDDFAFLVRCLGGVDTIIKKIIYDKHANRIIKFKHIIKFSTNISLVPESDCNNIHKNKAKRKIFSVEYIGEQECQCIKVSSSDHTYITDNVTVTHNTTSARIIANLMNENKCKPIELDCASHNGVDDMRVIIDECKVQPLYGKYKIFVLDECFVPETEILTDKGYKQFKDLDHTEKIAQYNDDGSIEFVTPIRYINQEYKGYLECWQPRPGHIVKMTPNHQQPLIDNKSGKIESKSICDIKFAQSNSLILAGNGIGQKDSLSDIDRLAIICQADGSIQYEKETYNRWSVSFKKDRKINRFLEIINRSGIEYTEINTSRVGYKSYTFNMPKTITKKLNTHFDLDFSYVGAREFIDEIKHWNGHTTKEYIYYSSTDIDNTNFVSAVATLGGYNAKQKIGIDNRSDKFSDTHRLWLYDITTRDCKHIQKYRTQEYYEGKVCCVEVPSHKIVVRADGYTFISGNCHMLTVQAWNALLKILEEPPSFVVFLFCTTDPQKIIGTVLSRVQRFNFQRISVDGVYNRLKYIIEKENSDYFNDTSVSEEEYIERQKAEAQGAVYIDFEDEALKYIARLAKGGMRDSITILEKCIDYSKSLTLSNVLKVTSGGVTEGDMIRLTNYILNHDCKSALLLYNQIYMGGVDVLLFIKLYTEFLQNCVKYLITLTASLTTLSENAIQWLDTVDKTKINIYINMFKNLLFTIMDIKTSYNADDLKILLESWLMKVCK